MGCLNTASKYFLFLTNFLVFALGLAVLGCGVWVLVDQPSFMNVIDEADKVCKEQSGGNVNCDDLKSGIALYSSAAYILIAFSVIAVLISFFGCCGAVKENRCMLGTYFTIILALFVAMLVGAIIGYSGNYEDQIKNPLKETLKLYDEDKTDAGNAAFRNAFDEIQKELRCCGIDSVKDWQTPSNTHNFPDNFNKPVGCCMVKRPNGEAISEEEQRTCRSDNGDSGSEKYYFKGCYTAIKDQVSDQRSLVVGLAIGVVVVMFLNMLFSFSMCMMVKN